MSSLPLTVSTVLASKLSTNENKTINTEIVIKRYEDKVFIIISQGNHKIGTLLQGCLEDHEDGSKSFSSITLLGKRDDPIHNVYLKHLVEFFSDTTVLLAIHLTEEGVGTELFQSIISFIKKSCSTW
jgi:hypothetical protein